MASNVRWGAGGGVTIGAFTAASQTSPMAGNLDARGFGQWTFQLKGGTITAGGITVQGTTDGTNWFDLTPDASSASTGANANPITSLDAQIRYKGPLYAVRGVSNGTFAGSTTLEGFAIP